MRIRQYCTEEQADGRDEGDWFRLIDEPDVPEKLRRRMVHCTGCYNAFYNYRQNVDGSTCWSLPDDGNFRGVKAGKRPKCYQKG
jgi:hypothetical protein